MIQDNKKESFDNRFYSEKRADASSKIVYFHNGKLLCHTVGNLNFLKDAIPGVKTEEEITWSFPSLGELYDLVSFEKINLTYIFHHEGDNFFMIIDDLSDFHPIFSSDSPFYEGFSYVEAMKFRSLMPLDTSYLVITAWQLYAWYRDNTFCGRCGEKMLIGRRERNVTCPSCKNMVFPKICPGVIVGVMSKGRILLTKYAKKGYNRYALVAGFTEIGETLEESAMRETMEEVGLKIKNIKFYKSQPWSASSSLLAGFFAEVDGDDTVSLDDNELKEATWFYPHEIIKMHEGVSLTEEMINFFADGNISC